MQCGSNGEQDPRDDGERGQTGRQREPLPPLARLSPFLPGDDRLGPDLHEGDRLDVPDALPLDPDARIWVNTGGGSPEAKIVSIPNSSLASQAVGPPVSDLEMSFFNRPFPMVGRKLLSLTPLGLQLVDPTDSVLGSLSRSPNKGLNTTYKALIQAVFQDKYWNGGSVSLPAGTFTQMEANFTLFWGLAIQLYETTLVSNRAPIDLFMEGNNSALSQQQAWASAQATA